MRRRRGLLVGLALTTCLVVGVPLVYFVLAPGGPVDTGADCAESGTAMSATQDCDGPTATPSTTTSSNTTPESEDPGDVRPNRSVRVASLNVLGHGHTRPGGNKEDWPSADKRTAAQIAELDRHDVQIVGLQEVQWFQRRAFLRGNRGVWRMWHAAGDPGNAVGWRTDAWRLVSAEGLLVPYFNGRPEAATVVRLRSRRTGQELYVINVHNPANVHGPAEEWREEATRRELRLATRLAETGVPVLLMGDFNERSEAFCDVTRSGVLRAAAGGSGGIPCRPPAYDGIDWIFGTSDLRLTDWRVETDLRARRMTDHPLLLATVRFADDAQR